VSKIEKTDSGYHIFIEGAEWFYRFTWIDESKGIAKWEYVYKDMLENKDRVEQSLS
jgi:hypothetical protein